MGDGPLTRFAHHRSCGSFRGWLSAWWDTAPWRLRLPDPYERCAMGGPVDDSVHCRRRTTNDFDLLCPHHLRQESAAVTPPSRDGRAGADFAAQAQLDAEEAEAGYPIGQTLKRPTPD